MKESLEARVQKRKESAQRMVQNRDPFLLKSNILFQTLIECEGYIYPGDTLTVRVGFVSIREGAEIAQYRPIVILSPENPAVSVVQKPLVCEKGEIFFCSFKTDGFPEGRYVVVVKYDENESHHAAHTFEILKRSTIETFLATFSEIADLKKTQHAGKEAGIPMDEFTWDGLLLLRDHAVKSEILTLIPTAEQEQFKLKLDEAFERAVKYWEGQLHAMFPDQAKQFLINTRRRQKI